MKPHSFLVCWAVKFIGLELEWVEHQGDSAGQRRSQGRSGGGSAPLYFTQNLQVNGIWKGVLVHLSVGPQWRHGQREQTYGPGGRSGRKEGQMSGESSVRKYIPP